MGAAGGGWHGGKCNHSRRRRALFCRNASKNSPETRRSNGQSSLVRIMRVCSPLSRGLDAFRLPLIQLMGTKQCLTIRGGFAGVCLQIWFCVAFVPSRPIACLFRVCGNTLARIPLYCSSVCARCSLTLPLPLLLPMCTLGHPACHRVPPAAVCSRPLRGLRSWRRWWQGRRR